jgi:aminoglycoside 6-adenylyltransferase
MQKHKDSENMAEKTDVERLYEMLIQRFRDWAENRHDIRTAFIVGSRARVDHAADRWADLDLVMITTSPESYMSSSDWIDNLGRPLLTLTELTPGEDNERRVLFEGMLDVDFVILPSERVLKLLQASSDPQIQTQIWNMLGRGIRMLVDKDNMLEQVQPIVASIEKLPIHKPTQQDFLQIVGDFLYHAVFTTKHLRRGELWWTVTCLDCHMQNLLRQMIEWHALATHDWKHDVWFRGRFLEEWAHPRALKELQGAFAHFDREDIKRSLIASMDLFRWLATETAEKLGYEYPAKADECVTKWIWTCVSETDNMKQ